MGIAICSIGVFYLLLKIVFSLNKDNPLIKPFQALGISAIFCGLITVLAISNHMAINLANNELITLTSSLYQVSLIVFGFSAFLVMTYAMITTLYYFRDVYKKKKL